MRLNLLLFLSLLCLQAFSQYPSTGNKQRLGYQTTGDGLVFRGNGAPAYTPTGLNNAWTYLDTVSRNIYTYVGGTWQLVSGGGSAFDGHVDSLVFNTNVTVIDSTAKMYWDANSETISVGVDGGAVYQMGEELYYPLVINKSGATILNGQLVMVDTATLVTGDKVRIILARNGATYPSSYIMGVATTDIPNDSTGLVTWFGYIREVKHADIAQTGVTLVPGNILYASATEPGRYTNVAPTTPAHKSTIALVVRKPSDNNMTLLVRPWLAPRLADLSDVNTSSVTGLSVLRYNSTTGIWDASATPGIVAADTAAMLSYYQTKLTNPVTGTGTANTAAFWNGTSTVTGGNRFFDNGTYSAFGTQNNGAYKSLASPASDYKNISLGGLTILYRDNYDFAFHSNSYYTSSGTLVAKYSNSFGAGYLSFAGANLNFATFNGSVTAESSYSPISRFRVAADGKVSINTTSPAYIFDINSTDAIRLPSGTTAQRPTGAAGVVRYNSELADLEFHNGTSWQELQTAITNPITGTGITTYIPQFNGTNSLTWTNAVYTSNRWGFNTASPSVLVDVNGQARVRTLGTGSITRLTGADADGVLGAVTLGTGLSISSGTLNATANGIQNFSINIFNAGVTVTNTTNPANFFLVPANLNGYCIDSYQVKALSGTGTADVQISKNGSGFFAQSISGTTTYNVNTNISLATGDIIQGNVSSLSAGATLTGLGLTIEIKATCN